MHKCVNERVFERQSKWRWNTRGAQVSFWFLTANVSDSIPLLSNVGQVHVSVHEWRGTELHHSKDSAAAFTDSSALWRVPVTQTAYARRVGSRTQKAEDNSLGGRRLPVRAAFLCYCHSCWWEIARTMGYIQAQIKRYQLEKTDLLKVHV